MIGIGITTIGILLVMLGLVGASIEVYVQVLSALVQQRVSAITEQLPAILRPEGAISSATSGAPFDSSMGILKSLFETILASPLWLTLTVVGIVLIYLGLFITQRPRLERRP